jgi:hypothetical protein
LGGGTHVLRFLPAGTDLGSHAVQQRTALAADRRTISVSADGQPRVFVEAVREMSEDPAVVTTLTGPRTAGYCLDRAARASGAGLVAEHDRWVAESEISPHDRSVFEDQVLAKALQLGATVDGLNLKNLAMAELLFRRRQLIQDVYATDPKNPRWDGWEHYLGIEERRGGAVIAPSLRAHVASEIGKEAAVLKERRKASEAKKGTK